MPTMHAEGEDWYPWCGRMRNKNWGACVAHALCDHQKGVWSSECGKPDWFGRALGGCVDATLNPLELAKGEGYKEIAKHLSGEDIRFVSRASEIFLKFGWVFDAASCGYGTYKATK